VVKYVNDNKRIIPYIHHYDIRIIILENFNLFSMFVIEIQSSDRSLLEHETSMYLCVYVLGCSAVCRLIFLQEKYKSQSVLTIVYILW